MNVRLPSGLIIHGVPDGTSKEAIKQKAILNGLATEKDFGQLPSSATGQQLAQAPGQLMSPAQEQLPSPTPKDPLWEEPGPFESALIGAGRGFVELGRGVANLVTGSSDYSAKPSENEIYAALQKKHPLATGIGESAPYVGGALAVGAATGGAGLVPSLLAQGGTGASIGGLMDAPTTEDRLKNAAREGALGVVGEGAGRVLGRVPSLFGVGKVRPLPGVAGQAQDAGFNVLPSTSSAGAGRMRQIFEGGLEAMPGSAPEMNRALAHNQGVLNKIAAESIGDSTAKNVSSEVLQEARDRIGATFKDLTNSRRAAIRPDSPIFDNLRAIKDSAIEPNITSSAEPVAKAVDRAIKALDDAAQGGSIPMKELMHHQSRLGSQARTEASKIGSNPEIVHGLRKIQGQLLDLMETGLSPVQREQFQTARAQYRNLVTLEHGAVVNSVTGDVSAASLASRLGRTDPRGFKEGRNVSDLYTGARFLGRMQPKLQTSGTAERSALGRILGSPLTTGGVGYTLGGVGGIAALLGGQNLLARGYLNAGRQTPELLLQALRAGTQGGPRGLLSSGGQ